MSLTTAIVLGRRVERLPHLGHRLVHTQISFRSCWAGAHRPPRLEPKSGLAREALRATPGGSHGDIATASVAVNSIPVILDAPAGLRTAKDLPIGFFPPNAKP